MNGKLIFTKVHLKRCAALVQDGKLMAASFQGEKEKVTGGIYIARIRDVVKDLNACFAEISKDLDIPKATVQDRRTKGIKRLRELLEAVP